MKLIFSILFSVISLVCIAQGKLIKFKTGMERALNGSGNPIQNASVYSNSNGQFTIRTLAQAKTILGLDTYTEGSILFADFDGTITEDNDNLFYNNSTNRVGIGKTSNLFATLDVVNAGIVPGLAISDVVPGGGDDFYVVHDNLNDKIFGNRISNFGDFEFHLYSGSGSQERVPFTISPNALDGVLQISPDWIDIGDAFFHGIVMDADGDTGNAGEIFSSTGTGTDWIEPAGGAADVESGTYQPAIGINLGNLTSATLEDRLNWFRVGNCVTVSGLITADPINVGQLTYFTIPTPTAMDFNPEDECGGTGAVSMNPNNVLVYINANDDDEVKFAWTPTTGSSQIMSFIFMYRIE